MGETRLRARQRSERQPWVKKDSVPVLSRYSPLLRDALCDSIGKIPGLVPPQSHSDFSTWLELNPLRVQRRMINPNREAPTCQSEVRHLPPTI
jgi:hypothetical protein